MYIALRELKIDTTDANGKRFLEIRQPGEPVPEAESWRNPGIWIMRGDITDAEGFVWRNRKKTGERLMVGEVAAPPPPDPTPEPPKVAELKPEPAAPKPPSRYDDPEAKPPTLEEVMAAGYSERLAVSIVAREAVLADTGDHEAGVVAADAALKAYDEEHSDPSDGAGGADEQPVELTELHHGGKVYGLRKIEPEPDDPSGLEERQDEDDPSDADERQPDTDGEGPDLEEQDAPEPDEDLEADDGDEDPDPSQPPADETVVEDETDPEPAEPAAAATPEPPKKIARKKLEMMTKAQLSAHAAMLGVTFKGFTRKGEMVKAILKAQG